jgi:hypothetical protein
VAATQRGSTCQVDARSPVDTAICKQGVSGSSPLSSTRQNSPITKRFSASVPVACPIGFRGPARVAPQLLGGQVPESIGDLRSPFVGGVQVDQRGPGAAPAHPGHQLPQIRPGRRGQIVSRVPQVMEMDGGQLRLPERGQPGPAPEVAPPQQCASWAGEDQGVVFGLGKASPPPERPQWSAAWPTLSSYSEPDHCRIKPYWIKAAALRATAALRHRALPLRDRPARERLLARRTTWITVGSAAGSGQQCSRLPRRPIFPVAATASRARFGVADAIGIRRPWTRHPLNRDWQL